MAGASRPDPSRLGPAGGDPGVPEPAPGPDPGGVGASPAAPAGAPPPAGFPDPALLWAALDEVKDPEIPTVSVVEMGIVTAVEVAGEGEVTVRATPTFVGCPALEVIRQAISRRLSQVPGVRRVQVVFQLDPPWTTDRITPAGREKLKAFGIAPPPPLALLDLQVAPPCPYCGSLDTHLENVFGPTACRSIYYCAACRNPFEAMKPV